MDNNYQPVGFSNATRQNVIPLSGLVYTANNTSTIQLPQVGLLARVFVNVHANITLSNGGSDAFSLNTAAEWPDPFRLLQRVRLYTGGGAEILNLTGAGLYYAQRIIKGLDNRNPPTTLASANTAASIYTAPASPAKNNTYDVTFTFELPVAWGAMLQAGLVSMQDPTTRLNVDLIWGNAATDLLTIGAGTITVNSVNVSTAEEIYQVPVHPQDYPDMTVAHTWSEEVVPVTATGRFTYKPTLGRTILDYVAAFSFNGTRATPAQVTQTYFQYAQTTNAYTEPAWLNAYRSRMILGEDLPDGVWWFPFDQSFGFVDINGTRDTFDTSLLTDLSLQWDVTAGTNLTNAYCRVVKRELTRWAG